MNKNVKHAISQTKDYACSSEFGKDFAKKAVLAGIGTLIGVFLANVVNNFTDENK